MSDEFTGECQETPLGLVTLYHQYPEQTQEDHIHAHVDGDQTVYQKLIIWGFIKQLGNHG